MSDLNTLTAAIQSRLAGAWIAPGADSSWSAVADGSVPGALNIGSNMVVLAEDAHDLDNQITATLTQRTGMLLLIMMPYFQNTATVQNPNVQMHVLTGVAISENPKIWRKAGRPSAQQMAIPVAQLLQNFKVPGFQYLRVQKAAFIRDKLMQEYDILIETMFVTPNQP